MQFKIQVMNYLETQITDHTEYKKGNSTLGLLTAEQNAIAKFKEEYPDNVDEFKYLKIIRSLSVN